MARTQRILRIPKYHRRFYRFNDHRGKLVNNNKNNNTVVPRECKEVHPAAVKPSLVWEIDDFATILHILDHILLCM